MPSLEHRLAEVRFCRTVERVKALEPRVDSLLLGCPDRSDPLRGRL